MSYFTLRWRASDQAGRTLNREGRRAPGFVVTCVGGCAHLGARMPNALGKTYSGPPSTMIETASTEALNCTPFVLECIWITTPC
jgi:hypothetical protein